MIAGEASGDLHGANLVKAILKRSAGLEIFGFGGAAMRRAGMRVVLDSAELAVVGITEVLSKLSVIRKGFRMAERMLHKNRPDLLILIDFPDFNLRVAAKAKKLGIPILYYISPQIWAWRRGRVKKIGKIVDHMAVILPFEEQFYRNHGVPVTFVGHPLLDEWHGNLPGVERLSHDEFTIGLLPGSRVGEIQRHLPVMLEAASTSSKAFPGLRFVISRAPEVDADLVENMCRPYTDRIKFKIDGQGARHVFNRVDLLVAASGTVTLEAAMAGTPMVVMYRVSPLSFFLGSFLIRVPHIALANLIAGDRVVPELVQHQASPEIISQHMNRLIADPGQLQAMRQRLLQTADKLGSPGASRRVADIALGMVDNGAG